MQRKTLGVLTTLIGLAGLATAQEDELRSSFGVYEGYSYPIFEGRVTQSRYVEMRDGVRLAVDIVRPTWEGELVEEPLPVVWTHSRYHRSPSGAMSGTDLTIVEANPALQRLVRHGYVVAAVCVRGGGASFGRFEGLFSEAETLDAIEMIEWFAEQPWCDGNVGMYGGSYLGITQYMAASKAPEALKAIIPDVAGFDFYDLLYPGGVFRGDMIGHWAALTKSLDNDVAPRPVDGDQDGSLAKQAVAEHVDNWDVMAGYASAPFRDQVTELMNWSRHAPAPFIDEIREARIPAYHLNGWFDVFALDTTLFFANWSGPQRMLMGDWSHGQLTRDRARLTEIEQLRWFDRWLKGIENGVEDEAPIQYALMIEPGQYEWMPAETWPPAGLESQELYLASGPSESVDSVNDGALTPEAGEAGSDAYRVDPTTTTGSTSRWDQAVGAAAAMIYDGLARNDEKCLTYTTPPLESDLMVIGHPVVRLWARSSSGDADLIVLLEEITADGAVQYVTEGVMRASLRKHSEPWYDNLGLPYQRCHREDAEPLPADVPAEIVMDLHPTATVFNEGNRLRISIMGADADNLEPAPGIDDTTLWIHHGGDQASSLELPVVR